MASKGNRILIIDFGSQYTQLIARRVRQHRVYCEIRPHTITLEQVNEFAPGALILSGGPSSVYDEDAPQMDQTILDLKLPILGICYGLQFVAHRLGGEVRASTHREYGRAQVTPHTNVPPCPSAGILSAFEPGNPFEVWMSHGDRIETLPQNFVALATTDSTPFAVIAHTEKPIVGLQFHPEVSHTPRGTEILAAFIFEVAKLKPDWTMGSFLKTEIAQLKKQVGANEHVICGLSGGVDSSVVATLLSRAIGDRLTCIFVDNGLVRRGEMEGVRDIIGKAMGIDVHVVDASDEFLRALAGVTDPETKRKQIGKVFIDVFEREAKQIKGAKYLAQGTLYPDVIESVSAKGPSATIKSHHNVGGLPERMALSLIEPLRELFKDEVRLLGEELGLPHHLCYRQPFPGPGLAVRILGEITRERLEILSHADLIVEEEIRSEDLYDRCWQSFAVLLPIHSVGVMGDERTYEQTIAIRCVDSVDGMTADWSRIPYDVLARMSNRIINEVHGINRVVYDISSKPPATIEWE